jgi:hypothetical protein
MTSERLKMQQDFITNKLKKCKLFEKYGLTLVDDNTIIINSMNGELCNTVQMFFKGGMYSEKKCEHCGTRESRQFDRAHNKGTDRRDVARAALRRIRPDETQPIKQHEFMRAFIEEHCNVPLWVLCRPCHLKYDKNTLSPQ